VATYPIPPPPTIEQVAAIARDYLPRLLGVMGVPASDVDDLVQEILIKAHGALDRYDPAYHGGRRSEEASIKAWLGGFAQGAVANHRRRLTRAAYAVRADVEPPDDKPSSEQLVAEQQRLRILRRVLARLPPAQADVLALAGFAGMTSKEIAAQARIDDATVRGRLMRGRARLRKEIARLPEDERSLLADALLLLPLGLGLEELDEVPEAPPARPLSAPLAAAGAMAALALGVGLGAAWSPRAPYEAPELPPVVAVREIAVSSTVEATASMPPAQVVATTAAPAATAARVSAPAGSTADEPTVEERALLTAARRARDRGEYARALLHLAAHERRFPRGALVAERERLRREVLDGARRTTP
jgi:RNA polymerase sigma factor (sigma-70 family)